jgi:hypothetical protein
MHVLEIKEVLGVILPIRMGRFNRSLKNDLKNVLKNREGTVSVFLETVSIQIPSQKPTRLNRPNCAAYPRHPFSVTKNF